MATYIFRCPTPGCFNTGGVVAPMGTTLVQPKCIDCGVTMIRDYRSEGVAVDKSLFRETAKQDITNPRDFLPTRNDFEKMAHDRGDKNPQISADRMIKDWKDNHEPAPENKRPVDISKL